MERREDIGFGGLQLIQNPDEFCYGIDAVILADFAYRFCDDFRFALDLGTGNGIIPFILSHKNKEARFLGVELQKDPVEMAKRSCKINGLESRIKFVQGDVAGPCGHIWKGESVDIVTCNPPYFPQNGGIPSSNESRYIARHETSATVEDFIRTAAEALKDRGDFFLVHRPFRLVDILHYCREYQLEPKDIRYVTPRIGEAPNIVLVHCVAGGGCRLNTMKELFVYGEDGGYSEEIEKIYERSE